MTISKSDLVDILSTKVGLTKREIKEVLDETFAAITTLAATDTVAIHGFGVFKTKVRAARVGRSPITQEAINIPEAEVLKFKATKHSK